MIGVLYASPIFGSPKDGEIQIIPEPKRMETTGEIFRLKTGTGVALADSRSAADHFAAEDFIADANLTANVKLKIGGGNILIGSLSDSRIKREFEKANFQTPSDLNDEGYALIVQSNKIIVGGKSDAGTFYGLQTLKQLIRGEAANAYIPGVRIIDYPAMRYRAFSDDISRGVVPKLEYVKRQIRMFAALKMNMHSLYMEHTFRSAAHPLFAPENGSFNGEELKEIVAYARNYHVEIVPQQQTFGHLHKVLKYEKYNRLAEIPYGDVLSPQETDSYRFVGDLHKELNEIFPSRFFHIGADETFELGEGKSRDEANAKGVGQVYFDHINRVRDLLAPYDKQLMMWGDIALNHPELINQIPKDMIVMNWAYGARETYAPRIEPFQKAGLRQFVCPSVWNFNHIFPNEDFAVVNIVNFTRDGQRAGAMGVMNTNWDDDGETLFEMDWYGVGLGAAAGWENAPLDAEKFDGKFDWAFFRAESGDFTKNIRTLGAASKTLKLENTTQNQLFWENPFAAPQFQKRAREKFSEAQTLRLAVEAVEENLIRNAARAKRHREMIPAMRFAARRFDHLGRRLILTEQFSRVYWDAYLNMSDKAKARKLAWYSGTIYNYLREMAEELAALKVEYRELYLAENQPSHLESVLARYDRSIQMWLEKAAQVNRALTRYEEIGTLPPPETLGLELRPAEKKQ